MDAMTWKRLRRAAAWVPVVAGGGAVGMAQVPMVHAHREAGVWTFHHEHVLGTSLDMRVAAKDGNTAARVERAVLAEFDRQQQILSAWQADSEFSRWSATRFEAVPVSPELMDVLSGFDHWRERTGGALDASAEAAIRLWRRAAAEGREPDEQEIAETLEAMRQEHWRLDRDHGTATRLSDVPLALASFAKSYVTNRVAEAALKAGATGVMLNVGGDAVVRGSMTQRVEIADPYAHAENDAPLDQVLVRDRAVATSGSYRRGIVEASAETPKWSHLVDPRTASPVGHIASSTVVAHDAETAGALATAFSVLSVDESRRLAETLPDVEYLLVTRGGAEIRSAGWSAFQAPGVRRIVYAPHAAAAGAADAGLWNPAYELTVGLQLPRLDDARYRRPYVAVWIEDADHFPVRTLALWTQNPRWLPELKQWYRDDQIRNLSEGTDVSKTISSATRPPGQYTLKWDGKDNEGKLVKAGTYKVVVEASREHGGYEVERHEMNFGGQPQQTTLPAGKELGAIALDYRKR